ncbi:MAG: conjugal transfer protein TrbI [Mastigocoleus sp.]
MHSQEKEVIGTPLDDNYDDPYSPTNPSQQSQDRKEYWNQESFADLLGFDKNQLQTEFSTQDSNSEGANPVRTDELFDNPHEGKTQPNFYSNPFAKFGAVGLVMLIVFGTAAIVVNSIIAQKPRHAPTIANKIIDKPKIEERTNDLENKTGRLKAQLALSTQAEKIKSIESSRIPNKKQPVQKKPNPQKNVSRINTSQIPSKPLKTASVAYTPKQNYRRYYSPRISSSQPIRPVVKNKPRILEGTYRKSVKSDIEVSSDPMEEWSKLNALGSYGTAKVTSLLESETQLAKQSLNTNINKTPTTNSLEPHTNSTLETLPKQSNLSQFESLNPRKTKIINGNKRKQFTVGTYATGKLITPIVSKNIRDNVSVNQRQKFIIQLLEPLSTQEGSIIVPEDSQIVVGIKDIHSSGMLQMEATQILVDGREYPLPANAIAIRGRSGKPLIASKWNKKNRDIAKRDIETFTVGSLAKIGKVLNQPKQEQISTNSSFGTSTFSSTTRSRSNILGAVLSGGFEPLTQQILQRNQRAITKMQQQEEVWFLKAGTDVQVFVNQSFQLSVNK